MKLGIVSDTHDDVSGLPHIIEQFRIRGVERIIHCGDIEPHHLKPECFLNLPVFCALTESQIGKPEFQVAPFGWNFTTPGDRIREITHGVLAYIGHKRTFELLMASEATFMDVLQTLRKDHDGIRWIFSGHTHHQTLVNTPIVGSVNPGAMESLYGGDGHEYAVIDTATHEVIFSRIMLTQPAIPDFSVGVISDSQNISQLDLLFWRKLARELDARGAHYLIHCGNMSMQDVGRPELRHIKVFFRKRASQSLPSYVPDNWVLIDNENPVVEINGYRFYVRFDLGADLLQQSEDGMRGIVLEIMREHHEIAFILCGFTSNALFIEGPETRILNPGDALRNRNFAVICLPRAEITFGHVPVDPLPQLS